MAYFELKGIGDGSDESLCFFDGFPRGFGYHLGSGDAVGHEYPKDAKLYMLKRHPGTRLCSYIGNTSGMLLVSKELRALFEKHCAPGTVEYLPVTIIDHKKRPYSSDYTIANPLGTYACVDKAASKIQWHEGKVLLVEQLVLSEEKLKRVPQLFRPDVWPRTYIFGPELVADIRAAKLTNVWLRPFETTR
ncbi:MAG TPA: DUF1629 domain-containing protein [Anaeromyxobacter sp.]|nr:DUF1629 domain-containing protein [Anaeromyxobacter sp.]